MENSISWLAYLIPISLVSGFLLFPLLAWLGKRDESKHIKRGHH